MKLTYVPATGKILKNDRVKHTKEDKLSATVMGKVPPMCPDAMDFKNPKGSKDDIMLEHNGDWVSVSEAIKDTPHDTPSILERSSEPISRIRNFQMCILLSSLLEFPTTSLHLHRAFSEIPIHSPDMAWPLQGTHKQQGPLEMDAPAAIQPSRSVRFDAKKYHMSVPGDIHDLYIGKYDLDPAKLAQLRWERAVKHNNEALVALRGISPVEKLDGMNSYPGSGSDDVRSAAEQLKDLVVNNLRSHNSLITHIIMGTSMYQRYMRNGGAHGLFDYGSSIGPSGMGPLPGLETVTAIVDPLVDVTDPYTIYAVDRRNGALYGQGPLLLMTNKDNPGRDGMGISEFYQYMIVDNNIRRDKIRTAFKIEVKP